MEKPVVLKQLYDFIEVADKLIVTASPFRDAPILYTSENKNDLKELRKHLVLIEPEGQLHCMCAGSPAIYLYKGDKVVLLTNHHGLSIRCSLWSNDVRVMDTEQWLTWFDERNIFEPREEFEETVE